MIGVSRAHLMNKAYSMNMLDESPSAVSRVINWKSRPENEEELFPVKELKLPRKSHSVWVHCVVGVKEDEIISQITFCFIRGTFSSLTRILLHRVPLYNHIFTPSKIAVNLVSNYCCPFISMWFLYSYSFDEIS